MVTARTVVCPVAAYFMFSCTQFNQKNWISAHRMPGKPKFVNLLQLVRSLRFQGVTLCGWCMEQ